MSENENVDTKKVKRFVKIGLSGFMLLMLSFCTVYTVDEGHVGIVKRFSEAREQVNPGLHFKLPFIDSVEEIEIRTRKNVEEHSASTFEQMPVKAKVSVNWTVNKSEALSLYKEYGSLEQFEERILDPKLRSASKDAIAKYKAGEIIQNRGKVISEISLTLQKEIEGFPVKLDSVQLEDVILPAKYLQAIEIKQTEKTLVDAEQHKLKRQKLEAQRAVNTAEAKRDATKAEADGQAYATLKEAEAEAKAITLKGEAEARAITAKAKALLGSKVLVDYMRAVTWDGKMPTTMLGSGSNVLLGIK